MTVEELISKLLPLDPLAKVMVERGGAYSEAVAVEESQELGSSIVWICDEAPKEQL